MLPEVDGIGDALVQLAARDKVELVMIGSRGLGAFKRNLLSVIGLGSISDHLVHHCACPVLVVRPQEHQHGE